MTVPTQLEREYAMLAKVLNARGYLLLVLPAAGGVLGG
jgi:hypothetical protein